MPPLLQAETLFAPNRLVISFDPAAVRERLTSQQRQIFDDHAPYDCLQLTVSDGSDHAFLVVKRRTQRLNARRLGGLGKVLPVRIPYSDILHCSAPELLSRRLERIKLAILRRRRTVALVAQARLFRVRPRGVMLPVRTCYLAFCTTPYNSRCIPRALMPGGSPYFPSIESVENCIGI
ncbi:hypothetical protein V1294_003645 [Bradyrhizobium sp. AZCC 1678]|uniref:hypothetical protein n=1 Tax=Bradyrhizobium sp. AZCC 1678 TaxID=3117030 RepID=UPI002FF0DF15